MPDSPPQGLVDTLERLGLASAQQCRRMGPRVRRLARDLPRFESVWVDALGQARVLTRFQAAEINAGRAQSLRLGPYLLCERLRWPAYVKAYRARHAVSGKVARLSVACGAVATDDALVRLAALVAASKKVRSAHVAPIFDAGIEDAADRDAAVGPETAHRDRRLWAASDWIDSPSAAEWMVHNGRFPPDAAIGIARAMLAGLSALEKAGLCHGDVSASSIVLTHGGDVVLQQPGLRGIVRPEEGFAHADLQPEAFDCLAPERIADGTPPSTASDIFACGCAWWHLLCGRPPFAGGDGLAKLRAVQVGRVLDVRQLAPDAPAPLASAIAACLERSPAARPDSMAELASILGPPEHAGRRAVARCLARPERWFASPGRSRRARRPSQRPATASVVLAVVSTIALAAGLLALAAAVWWPASKDRLLAMLPALAAGGKNATTPTERNAREARPVAVGEPAATPATYRAPRRPLDESPSATSDRVLDAAAPVELESLSLADGQCVRGAPGKRPTVRVPYRGLAIAADNVRFENVDFVWNHQPEIGQASEDAAAIVRAEGPRAEFHGCSFRSTGPGSMRPAAVRWTRRSEAAGAMLLPGGRVRLVDCLLYRVASGVDCRREGALAVEMRNVLHLGDGPLVRLDHCPAQEEPVRIALTQVTIRQGGPMLGCVCGRIADPPGDVAVEASGCAFVPAQGNPLLLFQGDDSPELLLRSIRWTGDGSLVAPATTIAAWQSAAAGRQALDDAKISIDGLVRSEVEFAGRPTSHPADSRIVGWQAPLRSTDAPGVDASRLPDCPD
jgi:hypothetical protein